MHDGVKRDNDLQRGQSLENNQHHLMIDGEPSITAFELANRPTSVHRLGVCARVSPAAVRIHRFWKPPNANNLSFLIGPPRVNPAWLRFSLSCCREKKLLAFNSVLRRNQKPFPWMLLVP